MPNYIRELVIGEMFGSIIHPFKTRTIFNIT
jgi:hypothetical protein